MQKELTLTMTRSVASTPCPHQNLSDSSRIFCRWSHVCHSSSHCFQCIIAPCETSWRRVLTTNGMQHTTKPLAISNHWSVVSKHCSTKVSMSQSSSKCGLATVLLLNGIHIQGSCPSWTMPCQHWTGVVSCCVWSRTLLHVFSWWFSIERRLAWETLMMLLHISNICYCIYKAMTLYWIPSRDKRYPFLMHSPNMLLNPQLRPSWTWALTTCTLPKSRRLVYSTLYVMSHSCMSLQGWSRKDRLRTSKMFLAHSVPNGLTAMWLKLRTKSSIMKKPLLFHCQRGIIYPIPYTEGIKTSQMSAVSPEHCLLARYEHRHPIIHWALQDVNPLPSTAHQPLQPTPTQEYPLQTLSTDLFYFNAHISLVISDFYSKILIIYIYLIAV